ncbi:hypothetical protein H5410_039660 [Solanum commersonii]|uniref:Uncharacterized protein n=1 Tax=Solanum commersonii TaxID=4109 RepID=A0A9J5XMW0_SOLCO|nr:hypothetical protein H5410_039660 [Solanum commersonii]
MLKGMFPHIYWTLCAVHYIYLMFEDIFKERPSQDKLSHIHGGISYPKIANPRISYPGITCSQPNDPLKLTWEEKRSSTNLSLVDEIEKGDDGVEDDDEQYNDN